MKRIFPFFMIAILLALGNCKKEAEVTPPEPMLISSQIPISGLVAHYPFNGDANDQSGNLLNGTVEGAQLTEDRHNVANSAYLFSDRMDVITINDSDLLDISKELTISVWINLTSGNVSGSRIVDKIVSGTGQGFLLDLYNPSNNSTEITNSVRFIGQEGFTSITQNEINIGEWTHIIASYYSGVVRFYINGELGSEEIEATNELLDNDQIMQIGNSIYGSGPKPLTSFKGKIDDVRIYKRVLNIDEIQALFME